jgi:hypothetical protein
MHKILVFAETAATTAAATTTAAIAATAAATATAKTAATPAATKTAAAPAGLGPGFIHIESARSQLVSIHRADGFFRLFIVGHLNKTKAARLAGIAVLQNSDVFDLPVSCKSLPKFIFCNVEIQITYIDILHAILLYWSAGASYGRSFGWLT